MVVTGVVLGDALAERLRGRRALGALLGRWGGVVGFRFRTLGGAADVGAVGTVGTLGSVGGATSDLGTLGGATVSAGFGQGVFMRWWFHWLWSCGAVLSCGS